jgi:hypothetical protein
MKSSMTKRATLTTAVLTAAGMSACGGGGNNTASMPTPPPPQQQQQSLDTTQVLALAQKPSETATPTVVNAGMLELNDTSETSFPVVINQ